MRILVIGQTTVHWGRLQYGNIGNYYITEATFRELHRVFPKAELVTTLQMTEDFSSQERVSCLPMDLFYNWDDSDVEKAMNEYAVAQLYHKTGELISTTPFIEEVMKSDLIADFSGELWGDHAEPVGKDRFLVGLLKDRVAQLLGKKTVLLAGSQGPFTDRRTLTLAKEVFAGFDMVLNREAASVELLNEYGFDTRKVRSFTDPAFLFDGFSEEKMTEIFKREGVGKKDRPTVGYILCGFNMLEGPYDKWPRRDDEFIQFAETVEMIVNDLGAKVVFMSHQNGFELPPNFKLINGRDFPYAKRLHDLVIQRGNITQEDLHLIDEPYLPKEVKAIIGQFDMLVTGRIHGFVAGVSQYVPSVVINRGNSPKSLRNLGFTRSVGFEDYLVHPSDLKEMKSKISDCFENREQLKRILEKRIPEVKARAHELYNTLKELF